MNPFIILLKFILLVSTVNPTEPPQDIGLNKFVIKKQAIYSPIHQVPSSVHTSGLKSSGSIMHAVSTKQELAIFCKMEHELMKASGFAVKFRLGDQSYVDQLEGK